jgi:AAA domain-containing protein
MTNPFQKATRFRLPVKVGIAGPSGSGKTLGALALAVQIAEAEGGRIAVIDTENKSASLYADRYDFDSLGLSPPYLSQKYIDALAAAIELGYKVVIIDTISHQWEGDGGILQRKEDADAVPGSNHWANWKPFTVEHNRFRAALLEAPVHLICTMRSKQMYAQSETGSKKKIEKLGLAPIQREGMEYEFTVCFDVQMDHKADASKDRTSLFTGKRSDLMDPKVGKALLGWLSIAAEAPPPPVVTHHAATNGDRITADTLLPKGEHAGIPLGAAPLDYVLKLAKTEGKWGEAAAEELERRRVREFEAAAVRQGKAVAS